MNTLLILLGAFSGLLSGILGIGGGIIIIPILNYYFIHEHIFSKELSVHMAVGTSLAIIFFTTIITAWNYYRKKLIHLNILKIFIPGLILGIIIGSDLNSRLNGHILEKFFGVFLLFVAVKTFYLPKQLPKHQLLSQSKKYISIVVSIIVGILAGLFGVGGGLIMVPYFNYLGFPLLKAVGTSAMCTIPIALIGTISSIYFGQENHHISLVYWPVVAPTAITSMIFSPIGTLIGKKLPADIIKYLLIIMLILTATKILLD